MYCELLLMFLCFILCMWFWFIKPIVKEIKKNKEMERIYILFISDRKIYNNDSEWKKWDDRIKKTFEKVLEEIFFESWSVKVCDELYAILKEYEKWRKQNLR